jgi:hypothetical protein
MKRNAAIALVATLLLLVLANLVALPPSLFETSGSLEAVKGNETTHTPTANTTIIEPRILYKIHKGRRAFPNAYNRRYQCRPRQRGPLPDSLENVLEYHTTIETNLNTVIMGDSVGMQVSGAYQRSAGESGQNPKQLLMVQHGYDILTHSFTASGGHVFGWRLSGMWLASTEGWPVRSRARQGGWNRQQVEMVLQAGNLTAVDALVFRISQGWVDLADVNEDSLSETVGLAHELLGVQVVTLLTLPVINNYVTVQDMEELGQANRRIHDFANKWNHANKQGPLVLVLDFGALVNDAARENARLVGIAATPTDVFVQRVGRTDKAKSAVGRAEEAWSKPAALVCAISPTSSTSEGGATSCPPNRISVDGVHVCKWSGRERF